MRREHIAYYFVIHGTSPCDNHGINACLHEAEVLRHRTFSCKQQRRSEVFPAKKHCGGVGNRVGKAMMAKRARLVVCLFIPKSRKPPFDSERKILRASATFLASGIENIFRWKTNFPLDYDGAIFIDGGETKSEQTASFSIVCISFLNSTFATRKNC